MQKTTRGDKRDGTSRRKDNKKRATKAIVSFEEDKGATLVIAPQAADKVKNKSRKKKKRCKELSQRGTHWDVWYAYA
jgi:hypothetical protein